MSKRRWRVGQCAMVAQREPRTLISDFSALRSAVVTGVLSVLLIVGWIPSGFKRSDEGNSFRFQTV